MPRIGWLAVGVAAGCLATTTPWVGSRWLAEPFAWATIAACWLLLVGSRRGGPVAMPRDRAESPLRAAMGPAALVVAGLLLAGLRAGTTPAAEAGDLTLPGGTGPWSAMVESVGSPRDGAQTATVILDHGGSGRPDRIHLAATLPRFPEVTPGDQVKLEGAIRPPPESDYGAYLRLSGVAGTIRSRSLDLLPAPDTPGRLVEALRRSAGDALVRTLPEPDAGLAAGILVGLRDRVSRDLAAAFTTAGVSHVVAISGWNIAIVAALVHAALRGWPRRRRSLVALGVIGLYTVLTGASASVVRAAIMAAAVTLARESGRAGSAAAALGWTAVIMLLADPATVGDAGFQLSALATAGLIAWASRLTARIAAWRGGRLPAWLAESLGVSLAAQAATLPVVVLLFGRLALYAPIVNLAVVPLVPAAMAGAGAALLAGLSGAAGAPDLLVNLASIPGWLVLTLMVTIVEFAAALPLAGLGLGPPFNAAASGLLVAGLALLSLGKVRLAGVTLGRPRPVGRIGGSSGARPGSGIPWAAVRRLLPSGRVERAIATVLVCVLFSVTFMAAHRPDGRTHVTVLDVGQGDAILVEGDRGSRMLIDGGPDADRLVSLLDDHFAPWDRRIDLVVLTHPHEDHVGGLPLLLGRYRIGRVVEPGMKGPGPGYRAWEAGLAAHGVRAGRLQTGDRFSLDDVAFQVLWPDPGAVPREPPDAGKGINNVSIVLLGRFEGRRMLLMGDVEEEIDPLLIARGLPRVDLLKVAHHGSRTASTGALLDAVDPAVAVVSAGLGNPYGHPAPATLDRLRAGGARVYRTDRDGSTEVTLGAGGMRVSTGGARPVAGIRPGVGSPFRCSIPMAAFGGGFAATFASGPASVPRASASRAPRPGAAAGAFPGPAAGYHRADARLRPGPEPPLREPGPGAIPRAEPRLLLGRRRVRTGPQGRSPRGAGRGRRRNSAGDVPDPRRQDQPERAGGARRDGAPVRRGHPRRGERPWAAAPLGRWPTRPAGRAPPGGAGERAGLPAAGRWPGSRAGPEHDASRGDPGSGR